MKPTFTNDSATISTSEYSLPADSTSLAAQTDDCLLHGWIDFGAMLAGDSYEVKLYEKINGGTARVTFHSTLVGLQAGPLVLPQMLLGEGWDLTVKRLAGTDRSIAWSLRKLIEGESVVFGAGAITSSSFAAGAIDAAAVAADTITSAKVADGFLTAAKIGADAITAAKLAADVTTELQSGLATAATQTTIINGLVAINADTDSIETDTQDIQSRLPAALVSGRMDSSVGAMAANVMTAAALAADAGTEIAAAVWAFAHETARSAKGVLVRLDAFMTGKATGLLGSTAAFFRADGSTKAIEATQDTTLGTRETASTVAGD